MVRTTVPSNLFFVLVLVLLLRLFVSLVTGYPRFAFLKCARFEFSPDVEEFGHLRPNRPSDQLPPRTPYRTLVHE